MKKTYLSEDDLFNEARELVNLYEAFDELPSLKAVVDECARELRKEGFSFNKDELFDLIEGEMIWQGYDRHEAPWFSEGIRAEMASRGFPVTLDETLDEAFAGHEEQIHWLIDSCGIAEAPISLESLWGPDCGYFYAASKNPQAILDSWIRLGIIDEKGSLLPLDRKESGHV